MARTSYAILHSRYRVPETVFPSSSTISYLVARSSCAQNCPIYSQVVRKVSITCTSWANWVIWASSPTLSLLGIASCALSVPFVPWVQISPSLSVHTFWYKHAESSPLRASVTSSDQASSRTFRFASLHCWLDMEEYFYAGRHFLFTSSYGERIYSFALSRWSFSAWSAPQLFWIN